MGRKPLSGFTPSGASSREVFSSLEWQISRFDFGFREMLRHSSCFGSEFQAASTLNILVVEFSLVEC